MNPDRMGVSFEPGLMYGFTPEEEDIRITSGAFMSLPFSSYCSRGGHVFGELIDSFEDYKRGKNKNVPSALES